VILKKSFQRNEHLKRAAHAHCTLLSHISYTIFIFSLERKNLNDTN